MLVSCPLGDFDLVANGLEGWKGSFVQVSFETFNSNKDLRRQSHQKFGSWLQMLQESPATVAQQSSV